MEDTHRFLRYLTPGIVFAVEITILLIYSLS
jgi:hypothetical protein